MPAQVFVELCRSDGFISAGLVFVWVSSLVWFAAHSHSRAPLLHPRVMMA